MSTASGTIRGDGNGNFQAEFTLPHGMKKTFEGKIHNTLPPFNAKTCQVVYSDLKDLSGSLVFGSDASVGPTTINLPLEGEDDSGSIITISGQLDLSLPTSYDAFGSGYWSSS